MCVCACVYHCMLCFYIHHNCNIYIHIINYDDIIIHIIIFSLVPVREQSTEAAKDVAKSKRYAYSPFKANNKAEFALARVDDLLNWARKVRAVGCLFLKN